jgi:hypothetical protein
VHAHGYIATACRGKIAFRDPDRAANRPGNDTFTVAGPGVRKFTVRALRK